MNPRSEMRNPPARVGDAVREGGLCVSERRFNAAQRSFHTLSLLSLARLLLHVRLWSRARLLGLAFAGPRHITSNSPRPRSAPCAIDRQDDAKGYSPANDLPLR